MEETEKQKKDARKGRKRGKRSVEGGVTDVLSFWRKKESENGGKKTVTEARKRKKLDHDSDNPAMRRGWDGEGGETAAASIADSERKKESGDFPS